MADAELLALWAGESCPICRKFKQAGRPFCETDFRAVTIFLRGQLLDLKPEAVTWYRTALQHLADFGPQRRANLSQDVGRGVRWPYSSDADLERAGFRFSRHAFCRVPRCGAAIEWWITPRSKYLAVNLEVSRGPHYATCTDPDYFARQKAQRAAEKKAVRDAARAAKRALQTSARRARGGR